LIVLYHKLSIFSIPLCIVFVNHIVV